MRVVYLAPTPRPGSETGGGGTVSQPSFRGNIGNIKEMAKPLGQSLALIAMMLSVVNAQCAVSCSRQSIAGSPASPYASHVDPDRIGHGCCPHQGVPKPKQQKDEVPCTHPIPTAGEARLNNTSASFNAIPAVVMSLSHQDCPQLGETYLHAIAAPGPWDRSYLSSIFILKI